MGRMFEKRKHTMFARWDRMAKMFTRASKDIIMAVKAGGENPDANPALRRALQNARAINMPKDKVQNAIDKALGNTDAEFVEKIYEGYAPHGVAVLVVTATDNGTRTVSNLRSHFKKNGGNLGNEGSVAFQFDHQGVFRIEPEQIGEREELELDLMDHGLVEMEDGEDDEGNPMVIVRCEFNDFGTMQSALEERNVEVKSSGAEYVPQTPIDLADDQVDEVLKLVDVLEQDDDVQDVFTTLS